MSRKVQQQRHTPLHDDRHPLHYTQQYLLQQEHGHGCVYGIVSDRKGCTCGLSAAMLDAGLTPEQVNERTAQWSGPFVQPDPSWAYKLPVQPSAVDRSLLTASWFASLQRLLKKAPADAELIYNVAEEALELWKYSDETIDDRTDHPIASFPLPVSLSVRG